jgi:NAD(P)H-dependent FMN reductase
VTDGGPRAPAPPADLADLPALDAAQVPRPGPARLFAAPPSHPPRILLLHGARRERSCSRLLTFEAQRLLDALGCDARVFHAGGLPLPDDAEASHSEVVALREAMLWSEGQVWTSPERRGAMSAVLKAQIDWIPLPGAAIRHPGDRVADELVTFTLLTRGVSDHLADRHSERKEAAAKREAQARAGEREPGASHSRASTSPTSLTDASGPQVEASNGAGRPGGSSAAYASSNG